MQEVQRLSKDKTYHLCGVSVVGREENTAENFHWFYMGGRPGWKLRAGGLLRATKGCKYLGPDLGQTDGFSI